MHMERKWRARQTNARANHRTSRRDPQRLSRKGSDGCKEFAPPRHRFECLLHGLVDETGSSALPDTPNSRSAVALRAGKPSISLTCELDRGHLYLYTY